MQPARSRSVHDLDEVAEIAMAVALSVVLGNLRLLDLPNGGSIAFGTLPILLLAVVRGVRVGTLCGVVGGMAHALMGGTIIHPVQFLVDYGLAYGALGLAGIARSASVPGIRWSVLVAGSAHLACFTWSGVIFFGEWLPAGAGLGFSLGYNATHVVPEMLLAAWLLPALVRAYARANPAWGYASGILSPPRRGGYGVSAAG